MSRIGVLGGAIVGFFVGNDLLPNLFVEPHVNLSSPEGAAYLETAVRLGTPILLGFLGHLAGEFAERKIHRQSVLP